MAASIPESVGRRLRKVSPAEVAGGDGRTAGRSSLPTVSHFDQLDDDQQRAFLRLLDGGSASAALPEGLVIVFTDYYRVERQ